MTTNIGDITEINGDECLDETTGELKTARKKPNYHSHHEEKRVRVVWLCEMKEIK